MKILIADTTLLDDKLYSKQSHKTQPLPEAAHHLLGLNKPKLYPSSSTHVHSNWSRTATSVFKPQDTLVVLNKVDLVKSVELEGLGGDMLRGRCGGADVCVMSCKTGDGVDMFMKSLENMLRMM